MEFLNYEKRLDTTDIDYIIERFEKGEIEDGERVRLKGTIHRIREMSGFAFVIIRTRRKLFQCVWEEEKTSLSVESLKES